MSAIRSAIRSAPADGGFSLIETVVGLSLLGLLIATGTPVLIGTFQASAGLGGKQAAVTIGSEQLEYVRSVAPDNLIKGRAYTDVAVLIASPGLVDLSDDVTASGNSDSAAAAGSTAAAIPLTSTQVLSGITYTVRTFINVCYLSATTGTCTEVSSSGSRSYRVSVDVAWTRPPGVGCSSARAGQCEYVVTTIIDSSSDPIFSLSGVPTITAVRDGSTSPAGALGPIHPGQVLTLQLQGSEYAYNAAVVSSTGDAIGSVSANTGSTITASFRASSTLGARLLSVVNPNGASASTTLTVSRSTPQVSAVGPTRAPRGVATTFTITGTDFFATPSTATQTVKPTLTLTGNAGGITFSPTVSNVTVVGSTGITFRTTMPPFVVPYSASATVTVTNPDGGTDDYTFNMTAT